ncbi:MAG TPA: hypothetical protein VHL09_07575, partial [Dehalococcoidia bacterium]|nr:hypothetical protein [Dehalococcoidia bacterium]
MDHVIRGWALGEQIAAGDRLPRWIPQLGLGRGFPLFVAYAPGLYYPLVGIAAVAGGYPAAAEWLTLALIVVLGLGAYCLGARWQGRAGGLLAAAGTVGAPYVLLDAESRGSLPELAVLAGLPWLLLAIDRALAATGRAATIWCCLLGAIGAALVWVYTFGPLLVLPVALAYIGIRLPGLRASARRSALARIALAGAIALGLSSLFWLPVLAWRDALATGPQASDATLGWNFRSAGDLIADWRSQIGRVWWERLTGNVGQSAAATDLPGIMARPMAPPVGLVAWTVIGTLVAGWLGTSAWARLGGLTIGGLTCLWLTLDASRWLWDLVPGLSFVQFPWRFFGPASVALGLSLAFLPAALPRRGRRLLAGVVAVAFVMLGLGNVSIARYPIDAALTESAVRRRELIGHLGTTSGAGQFLPRWA